MLSLTKDQKNKKLYDGKNSGLENALSTTSKPSCERRGKELIKGIKKKRSVPRASDRGYYPRCCS